MEKKRDKESTLFDLIYKENPFSLSIIYDELQSLSLQWTYSHLLEITTQFTCDLRRLLISCLDNRCQKRQFVIGIYAFNTPYTMAAILSILSLPAGYCPLRAGPQEWVWSQVNDAGTSVILVHISLIKEFLISQEEWLIKWNISTSLLKYDFVLVTYQSIISDSFPYSHSCTSTGLCLHCNEFKPLYQNTNVLETTTPHGGCGLSPIATGLAYLIYTSGSTGRPKPVWVPHCCVVPNILDLREKFGINSNDRVLNCAPLTFDPSVVEIFITLSVGGALLLVTPPIKSSPYLFTEIILKRHQVTILQATPTIIRRLPLHIIKEHLLGVWSSLRVLAFGGEACPSIETLREWKSIENTTSLFNIYGITEVSSWATSYEINLDHTHPNELGIPIGTPLQGTVLELKTTEQENIFQLYIGGQYRVCCIGDNEKKLQFNVPRDSGDSVYCLNDSSSNEHMYVLGRTDRQIKRNGHRINLEYVEQAINSFSIIKSCCVLERPHPLRLVAVASPLVTMPDERLKQLMFKEMRQHLTSSCIPDELILINEIPVNDHGKMDMIAIDKYISQNTSSLLASVSFTGATPTLTTPTITLEEWKHLIIESLHIVCGLILVEREKGTENNDKETTQYSKSIKLDDETKDETSDKLNIKLTDYGLTSFDIIRCINHLSAILKDTVSITNTLYELLTTECLIIAINTSYKHLWSPVAVESNNSNKVGGIKRKLSDSELKITPQIKKTFQTQITWYRRGVVWKNGNLDYFVLNSQITGEVESSWQLVQKWDVPTGACIDSSPLLVTRGNHDNVIYVGSHSGLVVAIVMELGTVKWRTQLNSRIESSVGVSFCGEYVLAGCYDGCLYTLQATDGGIVWCFSTKGSPGDPIKSCPTTDPMTGRVWFGSHDHHMYAVDIHEKRGIHEVYLGGGACFSSVSFLNDLPILITGTLGGNIVAINTNSGAIIWKYTCPGPIFSTPILLPNNDIITGCVNGSLYILNTQGNMVAELKTNGPVFTSCLVVKAMKTLPTRFLIYSGSHDSHMYCWENHHGDDNYFLKWKIELNSEIYSISTINHVTSHMTDVLCTCTTSGIVYLLCPISGRVLTSHTLPGKVFSSPILYDNCVVIGSRDNNMYCLSINEK